jgi:hypothetical protein
VWIPLVATRILLDTQIIDRKIAAELGNARYCVTCLEYKWVSLDTFAEYSQRVVPSDEMGQSDHLCRVPKWLVTVPYLSNRH